MLRDRLIALLSEELPEPLEVDLADVSYVDASGIATFVEGLRIARKRQTTLCLKGLQGRVLHLFEVAGIPELFARNGCGSSSSLPKGF
jgi:anti-sigma B factor antagonist